LINEPWLWTTFGQLWTSSQPGQQQQCGIVKSYFIFGQRPRRTNSNETSYRICI